MWYGIWDVFFANMDFNFEDGLIEPLQKKRKSGRSLTQCSVDGCLTKSGMGISFFRIPKLEPKCSQWKEALGLAGKNNKYSHLTPEQCHGRIKVCSLHFEPHCFSSENRIHSLAIPTLNLKNTENECDDEFIEEGNLKHIATQTNKDNIVPSLLYKAPLSNWGLNNPNIKIQMIQNQTPIQPIVNIKSEPAIEVHHNQLLGSNLDEPKNESDDSLDSTNFEPLPPNETFQKDQGTQTSIELTPILLVKPKNQMNVDQNLNIAEKETTLEDVYKFFENNYSPEACKLLKAQLEVLENSKKNLELPINTTLKHIFIKKV